MNFFRLTVLRWCLLLAAAGTQLPTGAAEPNASPPVALEFTLIGWGEAELKLAFVSGGRTEEITVPAFARSAIVDYRGPRDLAFTQADFAGKGPAPEIGRIRLPIHAQRVTLIAASAESGKVSLLAVPEDDATFPPNHARIVNLTPAPLALNYNLKTSVSIAPGKDVIIPSLNERVILKIAASVEGNLRLLLTTMMGVRTGERQVILLHQSDAAIFFIDDEGGLRPLEVFALPPWPKPPKSGGQSSSE
jgi:hypothetical protein